MPKKQVILVHGGGSWKTRAEYVADLKKEVFRIDSAPRAGWHKNLQKDLGPGFNVLLPDMPNWQCAKYAEWKIWFEKALAYAGGEPAVIGHSLGGIFLVKYFSETAKPPLVKGVFLVGAPHKTVTQDPDFGDFALKREPKRLKMQRVIFYHSQDDSFVDFADLKKYQQVLPGAGFKRFTNRGHFIGNRFPEIVKDIASISSSA
ncbi:MAG TPA: alpha/beta fold hydrolase [Verrucomicrobiae bacterium]|nr:alpha/beta fold hydrolase [Verrucomicrobiae bacterium]